ncbi:hypothetical protein OR16_38719 [Cupriavidus basilensis OR16]|uniref:Uncharacterized protein n=1 Tax=Cupriavidus basilensis OR16 TaxID=1127483 RepID=H1SH43_9BURK|nr:GDCCVxC domain-containing (seleno)protein [Cupriavidus basilensis]EHP38156.1 hypothetical protein OR16_38719 [Cupriavidus basilensis OR16]
MRTVLLQAIITCPHCGHRSAENMPTDACLWFYTCGDCNAVLKPKAGDCCVFCSYGDTRCPPRQQEPGERKRCFARAP